MDADFDPDDILALRKRLNELARTDVLVRRCLDVGYHHDLTEHHTFLLIAVLATEREIELEKRLIEQISLQPPKAMILSKPEDV